MSIYDFSIKSILNQDISLSKYEGKVVLIVNTATKCGYTPQYEELQALYAKYKEKGFVILDLPCNQFMSQAPGSNEEIAEFCQVNFNTAFETFAKVKVNGKEEIDLYTYLKKVKPYDETVGQEGSKPSVKDRLLGSKIKWNFTKFLIDKKGNVYGRYGSSLKPLALESTIEQLLK